MLIGESGSCGQVQVTSATTLTCVTNAPSSREKGPQPVRLNLYNWGVSTDTAAKYEYIDLWSRSTTWGGMTTP